MSNCERYDGECEICPSKCKRNLPVINKMPKDPGEKKMKKPVKAKEFALVLTREDMEAMINKMKESGDDWRNTVILNVVQIQKDQVSWRGEMR